MLKRWRINSAEAANYAAIGIRWVLSQELKRTLPGIEIWLTIRRNCAGQLDGKLLRLAGSVDRLADRMDANAARFSSSTVRGLVENADAPHRGRRHAQDRLAAGISAAGAGANGARRQRQRHSRSAAALPAVRTARVDFE